MARKLISIASFDFEIKDTISHIGIYGVIEDIVERSKWR